MKIEKIHKAILSALAVIIIAVTAFFTSFVPARVYPTFAETGDLNLDKTDVIEDLKGSSINGEPFALENYAFDERKSTTLLYLAEYCYSFYSRLQGNYNLYLYVWNPQGLDFLSDSSLNCVELSYGDFDTVGYDWYKITCLSVSTETNYERLFYKFKIELTNAQKTKILNTLDSSNRTYHVSGLEILSKGEVNPTDYALNKIYTYSGYAKGYGANPESDTLTYSSTFGDVLDITRQGGLRQTFYRPAGAASTDNDYTQDTLQTVYFSVPNKYFDDDYAIRSIRMKWLKALTAWGLVTGNQTVYNELKEWVGVNTYGQWEKSNSVLYQYQNANGGHLPTLYGFSTGLTGAYNGVSDDTAIRTVQYLAYLFPADSWITDSADNTKISWKTLNDFMKSYSDTYDYDRVYYDKDFVPPHVLGQEVEKGGNFIFEAPYDGELLTVDGVTYNYSRALFSEIEANVRKIDIMADKEYSLRNYTIGQHWWHRLFGKNGNYVVDSSTFDNIEAIHYVVPEDIKSSKLLTCDELYIDSSDYDDFKKFYDEATEKEETVVLVRYDVGKYQSAEGKQGIPYKSGLTSGYKNGDTNCYAFRQNVYLGLDVIHLEFDNGEESFILPVVSSPIDAGSGTTPPISTTSDIPWWWYVVAFVLLVLVVIVVYKLIKGGLSLIFKG